MEKRKVLGRGLDSLLGARKTNVAAVPAAIDVETPRSIVIAEMTGAVEEYPAEQIADGTTGEAIELQASAARKWPPEPGQVSELPINIIDSNPYQTRTTFDEFALNELADSIRAQGVLQPIVVRPGRVPGRFLLVLGERRLRASTKAGKATIPAIVKKVNEQQAAELTVIENLQRQDLNPLEQGEAFRVLSVDFRLTQEQIGQRVGLSRESVTNYMRLLKLPESVKKHLANGTIRFGEAKELLRLQNPEDVTRLANDLTKGSMPMKELRDLVTTLEMERLAGGKKLDEPKATARWVDPNVRAEQMELERSLGLRVKIFDRSGKGRIEIQYGSVEDYELVVGRLKKA